MNNKEPVDDAEFDEEAVSPPEVEGDQDVEEKSASTASDAAQSGPSESRELVPVNTPSLHEPDAVMIAHQVADTVPIP